VSALTAATLLVEDDSELAESIVDAFGDRGYLIDKAATWEEGLGEFRVGAYELVIADYKLPGSKHGLQLLVQMKMLLPCTRLVLISGEFGPIAQKLAAATSVIDAFLSKGPSLIEDLTGHVEAAASRADAVTDWKVFGSGYLADVTRDYPEVERIDAALTAHIARD
jgi:ActR/RegA family two-component response regulator